MLTKPPSKSPPKSCQNSLNTAVPRAADASWAADALPGSRSAGEEAVFGFTLVIARDIGLSSPRLLGLVRGRGRSALRAFYRVSGVLGAFYRVSGILGAFIESVVF